MDQVIVEAEGRTRVEAHDEDHRASLPAAPVHSGPRHGHSWDEQAHELRTVSAPSPVTQPSAVTTSYATREMQALTRHRAASGDVRIRDARGTRLAAVLGGTLLSTFGEHVRDGR